MLRLIFMSVACKLCSLCDCCNGPRSLQLRDREPLVMMMGADISHSLSGERGGARASERAKEEGRPLTPSVAAVVASINK